MDPLSVGAVFIALCGGAAFIRWKRRSSGGRKTFEGVVQGVVDEARHNAEQAGKWARALRSRPEAREVYVLAMQTLGEVELLLRAVETNPDDFNQTDLHLVGVETIEATLHELTEAMANMDSATLAQELEKTAATLRSVMEGFAQKRAALADDDRIVLQGHRGAAEELTGAHPEVIDTSSRKARNPQHP